MKLKCNKSNRWLFIRYNMFETNLCVNYVECLFLHKVFEMQTSVSTISERTCENLFSSNLSCDYVQDFVTLS